jgi:hypothetical protein
MKARIHFTTANGQETYADFDAPLVKVLNESAKQQLCEAFWFEFGNVGIDRIEEIN